MGNWNLPARCHPQPRSQSSLLTPHSSLQKSQCEKWARMARFFRKRAIVLQYRTNFLPWHQRTALPRTRQFCPHSGREPGGLHLMIANQASTTGSKGLERNLLVLLPAPSFPRSGMFSSLRTSQTPLMWTGRGKSIIPEIW